MVAFGCQPLHIKTDYILGAGINTQITALTVEFIDFDPSLDGHPPTSNFKTKDCISVRYFLSSLSIYYSPLLVLTVTDLIYKSTGFTVCSWFPGANSFKFNR
jgi:hypothetical protein